jgi:hypothetical protein
MSGHFLAHMSEESHSVGEKASVKMPATEGSEVLIVLYSEHHHQEGAFTELQSKRIIV